MITALREPSGPGVRNDSGYYAGARVPDVYDPMLSKLVVWAPDRTQALAKMRRALMEYSIAGVRTNISFHSDLMVHPEFVKAKLCTEFIDLHRDTLLNQAPSNELSDAIAIGATIARVQYERNNRALSKDAELKPPGTSISTWRRAPFSHQ